MVNINVTQRELAKRLGVSYVTVNRALGKYENVRPEMRRKILKEAQKLGYRKNALARGLKLQRTFSIGLVASNNPHSFWAELFQSMEQYARNLGYHIIICHRDAESLNSFEEIEFLLSLQVEGIVYASLPSDNVLTKLETVVKSGNPVLLLDQYKSGTSCSYLGTNSKEGVYKACEYLISMGHSRIAFVSGQRLFYTSQMRLAGYHEALQAAGIKSAEEIIIEAGWLREDGEAAAEKILSFKNIPTAIVAVNDPVAFGLFIKLKQHGIRIPEDISLIGYSGDKAGELLSVPMTTVAQPATKLGCRAMEILIAKIENSDTTPVFEELGDELIIRASCCPPSHQ